MGEGGVGGNESAVVSRVHVWGRGVSTFYSVSGGIYMKSPFPVRQTLMGQIPTLHRKALLLWLQPWSRKRCCTKISPTQCPGCANTSFSSRKGWHRREEGPRIHVQPHSSGRFSPNTHPCPSL